MPIGQLGMMLAGAGLGQILAPINDRRQLRQQEKLQNLQIAGQQQMTNYNLQKQMQLWEQTNYKAQVDQLKKAGLNPALLYGHSGPGGSTNLNTANIGIGQAPQGGGEIMGLMGMTQQAAMTAAQIELTKAQTEKTKAETGNVPLTGENIKASTENIIANTGNTKADTELKEIDASIKSIEETIKGATQNHAISMIKQELRANYAEMKIIERQNNVDEKIMDEKIKLMEIQVITAGLNNEQITKEIQLKGKTIEQVKQAMEIALRQIQNSENQTAIDQQLANFQTSFGGQAAQFLQAVIPLMGIKKPNKK